jgi:hypothetical protein
MVESHRHTPTVARTENKRAPESVSVMQSVSPSSSKIHRYLAGLLSD